MSRFFFCGLHFAHAAAILRLAFLLRKLASRREDNTPCAVLQREEALRSRSGYNRRREAANILSFFSSSRRRTRGRTNLFFWRCLLDLSLCCRRQTESHVPSSSFSQPALKRKPPDFGDLALPRAPRERERKGKKREKRARGGGGKERSSSFFLRLAFLPKREGPFCSQHFFFSSSFSSKSSSPSFLSLFLPSAGALAQSASQAQTATNEAIAELAVASVDATAAAAAPALASAYAAAPAAAVAAASVAEPRAIETVAASAEPQLAVSEAAAPATLELAASPAAAASAAVSDAATSQVLTNEGPPPQDLSLPLTYYEWSGLYVKRTPDGE